MIKEAVRGENKPVLVLDAGALLFDKPFLPSLQLPSKKEQAAGIMRALADMQYTAVGIAPFDLAAGSDFLEYLEAEYGIPFLSLNLIEKSSGRTIFKPYLLKSFGEVTVAILGVTAVQPEPPANGTPQDLAALSWEDELPKILQEIGTKADMMILLSSLPEDINKRIAQEFAQIDIILQSSASTVNRPVQLAGNALLARTASRGKYVGKIEINWLPGGTWGRESPGKKVTDINHRLEQVNWRLKMMEKRDAAGSPEQDALYRQLLKTGAELTAELEELARRETEAAEGHSTYRDSLISLQMSVPEDPEVQKILSTAKRTMYELSKKRPAKPAQER